MVVGIPNFIREGWIKLGNIMVCVCINRISTEGGQMTLVGNVDFAHVLSKAAVSFYLITIFRSVFRKSTYLFPGVLDPAFF